MKRYYLATLIEDPSEPGALIPDLPGVYNYVQAVSAEPAVGDTVLLLVATGDHRPLLRHPTLDAMPEFPLDAKINAMQSNARAALDLILNRRIGISANGADGYRDLIRQVGRQLDPNFHENAFDVSE